MDPKRFMRATLRAPADDGDDLTGADFGNEVTPPVKDEAAEAAAAAAAAAAKATEAGKAAEKDLQQQVDAKDGKDVPKDGKDDPKDAKDDPKDDDGKRKDTRIPLARHEALLNKERERRAELEQQLQNYQHGQRVEAANENITKAENDILTLEKTYAEQVAEGETAKAVETMGKIRKLERQITLSDSEMRIAAAEARAVERTRYSMTLERIEAAYPSLNEDHADFDKEQLAEVVELMEAYKARGSTPTQALQKAVKLLVEPKTERQKESVDVKPRVPENAAADANAKRKADAVKAAADATGKQPPNMAEIGQDSDKMGGKELKPEQIVTMSAKEFDALDEATLAKMRGDAL